MSDLAGWSVTVDPELCMGSGVCTVYAAATFTLSTAPAVVVDPPGDSIDTIRIAIEACPTGAIELVRAVEE